MNSQMNSQMKKQMITQLVELNKQDPITTFKKVIQGISHYDPIYAVACSEFCTQNTEFLPFSIYLPKFTTPKLPSNVTTVKQGIIYYICMSGVRRNFGLKLYNNIYTSHFINKEDIQRTLVYVNKNKKHSIDHVLQLSNEYSIDQFKTTITNKISSLPGIGVSGTAFLLKCFDSSIPFDYVEYTDIEFLNGCKQIYNLDKVPTSSQAKKIVDSWKTEYKFIGSVLCIQVYHYYNESQK